MFLQSPSKRNFPFLHQTLLKTTSSSLWCCYLSEVFFGGRVIKMGQKVFPEVIPNAFFLTLELGVLAFPIWWFSQALVFLAGVTGFV